ncbi:unnamed protein product (macronuclear) [Paramecium tetraurelia]|uniref:Uncharacterized protein n=1 Tax=Paramecium tetraurelia TaxID=5888 RepID=A0BQ20_PARTE|nr:uncharacterized protein GSPATT00005388001 [Paramecium tetraurelia]CAK60637.1 unnamed protein product [Paramecium tetraurelia]|eukprot:XP_001428035.1 hypothetical protein (macronuclear) [Paramecium tetraurelia strain d4-2]
MLRDAGVETTHQLIDKIEMRVKNFLKTQSTKQIQPLQLNNSNLDYNNRHISMYSKKEKGDSNIFSQLENIPPQRQLTQCSRTSDCQIPLLKEIQEIDQSYKIEIDQLKNTIVQLKQVIEELKECISGLTQQLDFKQREADQVNKENENTKILVQTLRDENSYLTREIQQLINEQHSNNPKVSSLNIEVQEERKRSEKLQLEISEIKMRVEKQRDSAKTNSDSQIIEKLVHKLEDAQEQQQRQNQQFMKYVIQYLEKQQNQQLKPTSTLLLSNHKKQKSSLKKK